MLSREMKDSGVEWIGEIPIDWETRRLKVALLREKNVVEKYNGENILSLTMNGVIVRDLVNPKGKMPVTFDGYQKISEGNIIACLFDIDVTPRCVGIAEIDGLTSPAYTQYKVINNFDTIFLYYYLLMLDNDKVLVPITKSLRNTIKSEDFLNLEFSFPNRRTQERISTFLTENISKINNLILETQQSIEELNKYKQSLITKAVTKGLDPNVEMKDSGREVVGKYPKHWNISKIKYEVELDPSKKSHSNELPSKATFLPMNKLKNGYLLSTESDQTANLENKYTYFAERDIVIAKVRPSFENGNIAIANDLMNDIGFGTTEIFVLRNRNLNINQEFLFYFLRSETFINLGSASMTGVAGLQRVSSDFIMNYLIAIPSEREQYQIIEYLDNKVKQIDNLVSKKSKVITELEQYKKSLIYEYVTGKKEV